MRGLRQADSTLMARQVAATIAAAATATQNAKQLLAVEQDLSQLGA